MSDFYTCITCRIAFKDGDSQRSHYKTDWHRYNLKRKVAELPPVTAEEFINRVNLQRNEIQEYNKDKSQYCECCKKSFNNEKSYANHLNSKKHKDNEIYKADMPKIMKNGSGKETKKPEVEKDDDVEEVDSDEWEDFENPAKQNICLFCDHRSRSLIKNLRHMSAFHSFFIPDAEFCVDLKGLVNYLGEKVYYGYLCLWCGKSFFSSASVQTHMKDKNHCKMLHEEEKLLEYSDFYDYSSSYPDNNEAVDADEEVELPTLDGSEYQLVLPSGAVIGHRSLVRYYKQKFNPNSVVVAKPKQIKTGRTLYKVLAQYKALGYTETKKELVMKKAKDIKYMHRIQSKWTTNLGVKANKLQHHFRQQVRF